MVALPGRIFDQIFCPFRDTFPEDGDAQKLLNSNDEQYLSSILYVKLHWYPSTTVWVMLHTHHHAVPAQNPLQHSYWADDKNNNEKYETY